MQPVDDLGFRHLIQSFEPQYDPLTRKTMSTKYLPQMSEGKKEKVKHSLLDVQSFSLTTNIWTSRANHTYTGLTIHFVDFEFELQHCPLETREFHDSHTASNLADELTEILKNWGLNEDNISAITTDNGKKNIVAAIKKLGWGHFPCFLHTLKLGV